VEDGDKFVAGDGAGGTAKDGDSVQPGRHAVEEDEIVTGGEGLSEALGAVVRRVDGDLLLLKILADEMGQFDVIVD